MEYATNYQNKGDSQLLHQHSTPSKTVRDRLGKKLADIKLCRNLPELTLLIRLNGKGTSYSSHRHNDLSHTVV